MAAQDNPAGPGAPGTSAEQALVDDLPVVQAAALHQQTLQEAPANVTVVSRAEIRRYGYRTLGEALNSVRGFYLTDDRIYHYIGVSGIGLPGDFNTRILVMIDGHAMTEYVYDSNNFFGQDFGLDMDLVERIEIIRGSASALYGTNAMLATINVITQSPADAAGLRMSSETGAFGEKKLFVSDSVYLGKGANLLLSGSLFDNSGQTLSIPGFGVTSNSDAERGYHTFANLIWGDWSVTAYFNTRRKNVPVNWAGGTVFGDGGSHVRDGRNFVEAARSQDVGASGKLRYRFYYDDYRYDDRFDYYETGNSGPIGTGQSGASLSDAGQSYIQDQRSHSRNEWAGSEITWQHPFTGRGDLTFGFQGEFEFRNLEDEFAVAPSPVELVWFNVPDRTSALFTQQEWRVSSRWKAYAGLRLDYSRNYGDHLSPKVAVVYQRSAATVFKAVYGSPFRNPSAWEKYFNDNETVTANPNLHAEGAQTFELSAERTLKTGLTAILDLYHYRTHDLIEEFFPDNGIPQYRNLVRANSTGIEAELSKKLPQGFELLASGAFQTTRDADTGLALPNSPHVLAKLRIGDQVFRHRAFLASSVEYMSARDVGDGTSVAPVFLQDATLTTLRAPAAGLNVQAGVRNLWNRRYEDPVGLAVSVMQQDGRSFFVKVVWDDRK